MKKFIEALPGLVFAALYFGNWAIFGNWDIYLATAGLMVSAFLQVLVMKLNGWKISAMIGLFFWLAMIFGGMTLIFQNIVFIQWKPTIFHWGAALAILSSRFIGDGHFIRDALGRFLSLDLPDRAWKHLTWGWAMGWFTMGALNLYVAYQFSEQVWMAYKPVAGFVLSLALVFASYFYLYRSHLLPHNSGLESDSSETNPNN